MNFQKAAILGATGPAGRAIAKRLSAEGVAVRAVSRNGAHLERSFPEASIDRHVADVLDAAAARRAVEGCDLVFHCIGLPGRLIHLHPVAARNVAAAIAGGAARCVHVSSYWAFLPLVGMPMNEDHPRQGGPPWVRHRRAAEDVLREAGAAIANLPDFYGPDVHTSTLQQALADAAAGKKMRWIGRGDIEREYAFIPDAAALVVELARREQAYGEHWLLPTAGLLSGEKAAAIAGDILGREVRLQTAGPFLLRLVSLFNEELRGFMQMVPEYTHPIAYETAKIETLLGRPHATSYGDGFRRTLEWLRFS